MKKACDPGENVSTSNFKLSVLREIINLRKTTTKK